MESVKGKSCIQESRARLHLAGSSAIISLTT